VTGPFGMPVTPPDRELGSAGLCTLAAGLRTKTRRDSFVWLRRLSAAGECEGSHLRPQMPLRHVDHHVGQS
jgi:hypothetical protein